MINIILFILGLLVAFVLVIVIKTLLIKPTPAKDVEINLDVTEIDEYHAQRLAKMIQIPTISSEDNQDLTNFYKLHEVLKELFPLVFAKCEIFEKEGNLLFKWQGKSSEQPIMLMSHQDIVEATGTWQHQPFSGEISDGKIWGRGTVDTKGSLYCIFESFEQLLKEDYLPNHDIYLASSATEEIFGNGAPIIKEHLQKNNVQLRMLLDEGGMVIKDPIAGLKGVYGVVGVLEKGQGNLKIIAKGSGGHSSTPGKNTPIPRLAEFINEIEKKSPFKPVINDTIAEMFRRFAPNMTFSNRLLLGNLTIFKPLVAKILPSLSPISGAMIKTTIAFTMQEGSQGYNVIPQEAYVIANLRFIHHQDKDDSIRIITNIAKKYDLEVEDLNGSPACPIVDYKSAEFKLVEEVMNEVYPNVGVSPYPMTGGTDAKFFTDVCDNCLRFAPLYITNEQNKGIHGLDENLNIATLKYGIEFYKKIIKKC